MGNKVIEYVIGAKDATGKAISSALARIKSFASGVGSNLMNIKAGLDMLQGAVSKAMSFLSKAFAFEKMTVQFKTLIGNMDEARAHMAMLQEMGDTPPFSLEEFAAASRTLMVMTDGVLGFKNSLELCGDAAAAIGKPVQELAHEVGRAYAIIRDGQPLTRATMALRNMGAITPEVAARLEDMQKAGAKNIEVWNELETALKKYKGAMEETEQTGDGLIGAIQAQWDDTLREFGEACLETVKDGLGALLDKIKELNEDGTIEQWAKATVSALGMVGKAAMAVGGFFGQVWNHLKEGREAYKEIKQEAAEASGEEESFEFLREEKVNPYTSKKYYKGSQGSERVEVIEDKAEKKKYEKKKREETRLAKEALREAEKKAKLEAQMAEAQKKQDEKAAKEKAAKKEEAARKAAEAAAKEAEKQREKEEAAAKEAEKNRQKEEAERLRLEERIHAKRVQLMQDELAQRHREEQDAQQRLAAAISQESRAWGWYRDRDSWKAQLKEERDEAAAQKQFDKDFAKLKDRHRDWRTAKLGDDDELIKRVALAREEKANAQEYARMTAESTQRAADALAAIQAEMEGV